MSWWDKEDVEMWHGIGRDDIGFKVKVEGLEDWVTTIRGEESKIDEEKELDEYKDEKLESVSKGKCD